MYNSKEIVVDPELTFLSYNQTINAEFTVEEILKSYLWITDYTPIFEDIGVTGNKNNKWVNQASAWSVSTDSTGTTLTEQKAGNYTPSNIANSTNWKDSLKFDLGYYVEFDVVNVNRAMFRVYYRGGSIQSTFVLETGHYKFFVDGGVIRYWFDGVEQGKIDNPDIQGSLIFSFVASNDEVTSSLKYKNFKIYKSRLIKAVPLFNCDKIISSNSSDKVLDGNKCVILENDMDTIVKCISDDTGSMHYHSVELYAYAPYTKLDVIDEVTVYCILHDEYLNTVGNVNVDVYIDDELSSSVLSDSNGVCRFKVDQPCTVKFVYGELESNDVVVRSHDYSLSISVDKESLSTDESVTVTGVLMVDGEVYADQSIDLYDGVSLVDTLTTDSNGEYTKTFTGLSAGTYVFRAVHTNVQSSTVRVVVHDYSLTVTGDSIIQSGDVDSIIVTLKDNGVVVSGETLSYQIKHGSTTIDTGTDTTDNNGQISITYTGTGIGDVDVIVSYSNIQETYELLDCYCYDGGVTGNKSTAWTASSNISISTDDTGTLLSASSNQTYISSKLLTGDFEATFTATNSGGIRIGFNKASSPSVQTKIITPTGDNTWYYKINRIGSTWRFQYSSDGETWNDRSIIVNNITDEDCYFLFSIEVVGSTRTIKYKDLKIYSI